MWTALRGMYQRSAIARMVYTELRDSDGESSTGEETKSKLYHSTSSTLSKVAAPFAGLFLVAFILRLWSGPLLGVGQDCDCDTGDAIRWPNATGTNATLLTCGSSTAEALTSGCMFELWSFSWIPEPCFDADLHDEFLKTWPSREPVIGGYYSDVKGSVQIPLENVLQGTANGSFTTWGQHYWHCAFALRKIFRILEEENLAESMSLMTALDRSTHHLNHCEDVVANPLKHDWKYIYSEQYIRFRTCRGKIGE
ncbi:hypothetical protein CLAFUW4_10883 [Fulvia fulva]|uniref:Uncharacterized protein n=1 Tax=Passalora fulva TaxID=5499 RepID=A0A9Q8US69_PASFU|nr:uncharacterized protein CLAFUR5_09925 [Fulvia fulva]KAK4619301.1 hypothetical protein CLAFUR4_10888 [Fulvia fulva]KAK4621029.1 hypothetical protein CLAFUR0_10895 [Fulvia fulva]UJO20470.1 hypothetical protein CLAFUR5_09925 [Fulvia fulva]WPV16857.1 hypothetical protein CLAFUW4_10883 [Fulvia fulva]WPV32036.1 hypothetical protein CLAFUW7_10881 [Fulvia fulva]